MSFKAAGRVSKLDCEGDEGVLLKPAFHEVLDFFFPCFLAGPWGGCLVVSEGACIEVMGKRQLHLRGWKSLSEEDALRILGKIT